MRLKCYFCIVLKQEDRADAWDFPHWEHYEFVNIQIYIW